MNAASTWTEPGSTASFWTLRGRLTWTAPREPVVAFRKASRTAAGSCPARLGTAERLAAEARAFADWVKASPPSRSGPVQLPGEPERAFRRQRSEHGVPIDDTTWAQMLQSGVKLGLEVAALAAIAQPR